MFSTVGSVQFLLGTWPMEVLPKFCPPKRKPKGNPTLQKLPTPKVCSFFGAGEHPPAPFLETENSKFQVPSSAAGLILRALLAQGLFLGLILRQRLGTPQRHLKKIVDFSQPPREFVFGQGGVWGRLRLKCWIPVKEKS